MESAFLVSTEQALNNFHIDEKQGLSDSRVKEATAKYGRNGMSLLRY